MKFFMSVTLLLLSLNVLSKDFSICRESIKKISQRLKYAISEDLNGYTLFAYTDGWSGHVYLHSFGNKPPFNAYQYVSKEETKCEYYETFGIITGTYYYGDSSCNDILSLKNNKKVKNVKNVKSLSFDTMVTRNYIIYLTFFNHIVTSKESLSKDEKRDADLCLQEISKEQVTKKNLELLRKTIQKL